MAKKKSSKALTKRQKAWKWTKRGALAAGALVAVREVYLGLGPRRDRRRAVYEQAARRAMELGRPLVVLGDPDGGLANRALGRQWQCGDICIDRFGCGTCAEWVQGRPEDVLRELDSGSYVVYDPGAFALADDARALASEITRVAGGEVYMADAGPWTLTSFFGPKRKRRVLVEPQLRPDAEVTYQPLPWHRDPVTGGSKVSLALHGVRYPATVPYLQMGDPRKMLSGLGYGRRFG